MRKLSITSIVTFVLLLPTVLAATHSVQTDMTSFVNAFKYLFKGNTTGFVSGVVGAIPLLAVVLIVFGLAFFLGKLTIFKDTAHTKYARMVAIGIALLGLATQSVYNAILNWSSAFLNVAFIIAIVFMFIMFLNFLRKENYGMSKEMREAYKDSLGAKKELKHMQHEFKLDERERDRVMRDLGDLSEKLDSMKKLSGSELQMIDKLADLLRKATTAASRNDQQAAHGYAQMLTKEIGTLITTMKHEEAQETGIDKLLVEIDGALDRWGHHADLEQNEEKHLNVIFSKVSSKVASAGATASKRLADELLKQDDKNLLHELRQLRAKLMELSNLRNVLMKTAEELQNSGYKAKHMEAQAVRTAIFNLQFTEAHNHLDRLRSLVEREPSVVNNLQGLEHQMNHLLSALGEMQKNLDSMLVSELAKVVKTIENEKADAKKEKKSYAATSDDIFGTADRLATSVKKLIDSLKYIAQERMVIPGQRGGEAVRERDEIKSAIGALQGEHEHLMALAGKQGKSDLDLKQEMKHFKELLRRLLEMATSVEHMLKQFGGAPNSLRSAELFKGEVEHAIKKLNAEIVKASNESNSPLSLPR